MDSFSFPDSWPAFPLALSAPTTICKYSTLQTQTQNFLISSSVPFRSLHPQALWEHNIASLGFKKLYCPQVAAVPGARPACRLPHPNPVSISSSSISHTGSLPSALCVPSSAHSPALLPTGMSALFLLSGLSPLSPHHSDVSVLSFRWKSFLPSCTSSSGKRRCAQRFPCMSVPTLLFHPCSVD